MADALDTVKEINESTDKYLFYKLSRPIKDLKHMDPSVIHETMRP